MKKILVLTLLIFVAPLIAAGQDKGKDALYVQLMLIMGERSRDSHSTVTTITVADNLVLYEKIYRGRFGNRPPDRKEFKLTETDKANLIKLIKDHNLLRTEQLEREEKPSGVRRYFALTVNADVNGSKGVLQLKGPRDATDIKDKKLYKDALSLLEKIYPILGKADRTIVYQPPID